MYKIKIWNDKKTVFLVLHKIAVYLIINGSLYLMEYNNPIYIVIFEYKDVLKYLKLIKLFYIPTGSLKILKWSIIIK